MEPEDCAQRGQTGCVGWGVRVEAVSDGREPMGPGIGWVLGLACGSIKATELGLDAAWDTWTDTDPTQTHAHTREGQFLKDVFSVHGEG